MFQYTYLSELFLSEIIFSGSTWTSCLGMQRRTGNPLCAFLFFTNHFAIVLCSRILSVLGFPRGRKACYFKIWKQKKHFEMNGKLYVILYMKVISF